MFKQYSQNQIQLLPPNLEEMLSPDHLARLISRVVEGMNLDFIESTYSSDGCHAYHPRMLIKVLVYGYTIGIRSSRKLADRLKEDVVFMWLSGRQTPDFRTISDFRKDRLVDVKKIFIQVLKLCHDLGMVRVGKVSFDGTKILANSSRGKMIYRKVLEKRQINLTHQVEQILEEAEVLDQEEEKLYGNQTEHQTGLTEKEITQRLAKINRRKETIKKQMDKLNAKKQDNQSKLRKIRKDRNSMSLTDQTATMMQMKEGYPAPAYNVQLASEHQVIEAYQLSSNRNDNKLLKPLNQEVKENTGQYPEEVVADAGYGNKSNYRYLKQKKITSFIPYNNFNQEMTLRRKNLYQLPKSPDVELEKYHARQRLRLLSPAGKEMMKRRREDIEPTIGDVKRNMEFRRFNLRGKRKCLIELGLVSLGHNLKKIKSWLRKQTEYTLNTAKTEELSQVLGYLPTMI